MTCMLVTGCKNAQFYYNKPEGPPDYVEGWDDGCDSAHASGGSILQRFYFRYTKNPDKLDNNLYKLGWSEGWSFCRFTLNAPKNF